MDGRNELREPLGHPRAAGERESIDILRQAVMLAIIAIDCERNGLTPDGNVRERLARALKQTDHAEAAAASRSAPEREGWQQGIDAALAEIDRYVHDTSPSPESCYDLGRLRARIIRLASPGADPRSAAPVEPEFTPEQIAELQRDYDAWLAKRRQPMELIVKWRETAAEGGHINREPAIQVFNETLLSCANELEAALSPAGVERKE